MINPSFKKPFSFIRDFVTDQKGAIAIETVVMIPIIVWCYLAMFTIFDTFRQYTTQQKAAYTVSDLISRQATPVDADFIDGLHELFNALSRSQAGVAIRVTVAKYDLLNQEYEVVWSQTRGGMIALQSADIANWNDRLPVMPQDDQVIIVESTSDFRPVFAIGLADQTINNFVFTRPRYADQMCFNLICS